MHPLTYKQLRQLLNALRRSVSSPRQFLAFLIVLLYGITSIGIIVALIIFPLPRVMTALLTNLGLQGDALTRLQELRGSLTLTLLLLTSTAIFQNPLLRFGAADADMLFATPVPITQVVVGRMLLNHLRAFFAAYFFWGLAFVPILRLLNLATMPDGAWALAGLALLFACVDQIFAALTMVLQRNADTLTEPHTVAPMLLLTRGMLLLFGTVVLLLLLVLIARFTSGTWDLLGQVLRVIGGPILAGVLFPLGWTTELLFLAAYRPWPLRNALFPLASLLLLDVGSALLLLRIITRNGAGILIETAFSPVGNAMRLRELIRTIGRNPLRLAWALWQGADAAESTQRDPALRQTSLRLSWLNGANTHSWRRLIELQRTPWRNLIALLVLGFVPLAIYNPRTPYSLTRLITAIVFSTSLSTQMFNDVADHLIHANMELSAPQPRWRILFAAYLPRMLLYWLGGLVMLIGVGLISTNPRYDDLLLLAAWYPFVLIPLLALRTTLVFLYPAAGIPTQRDPVQAVMITLINGLLVMLVLGISLAPFGILLALANVISVNRSLLWSVVFSCSMMLSLICTLLASWAYQRYEPGEGGA